MNNSTTPYPANPLQVPVSVTSPSATFKREVKKVMGTISLFFIVYLVLITLSILLSIVCVMLGIGLMSVLANFIGLAAGLGIISIGVLVFIFLVKFIFSVKKFDDSGSLEIKQADQPVLFDFIRKLTEDTQTPFPRKIVLSPDVNACVFYNDSFWSMVFPVKKNLQIGLGLVNTLTISEFKAVMAHEFGHFSQRSMKLGSFVYNVNKVIYNMLFENKNYASFLRRWSSLHWAIYIFASVTVKLVTGIQLVLQKMYGLINKSYMGLSREMEFHADAVAASVSGSNHLIAALQKIEVGDSCYNTAIQKANDWLREKGVFENIYTKHQVVMQQYAKEYNLPLMNSTPVLNSGFLKNFRHSKINIKNQWASHPTREDREAQLSQLQIEAVSDDRPAWLLFNEPLQLQKDLTAGLYKTVPADMRQQLINPEAFRERYLNDIDAYNLPPEYNGYYDQRVMNQLDVEKIFTDMPSAEVSQSYFDSLFNDDKMGLLRTVKTSVQDAAILEAIIDKQVDIKTFDYDGKKYEKGAAPALLESLKAEMVLQQEALQHNEESIARFFYAAAKRKNNDSAEGLKNTYLLFFANKKKTDEHTAICNRVASALSSMAGGRQFDLITAEQLAAELRKESNLLRPLLTEWLDKGLFDNNAALKETATRFCGARYQYFLTDTFLTTELEELTEITNGSVHELSLFQFRKFKTLLEQQLTICREHLD